MRPAQGDILEGRATIAIYMEPKITVKTQSLPERCDICHQMDLFDPLTGDCARCKEAKAIALQSDISLAATLKSYLPVLEMPVASTGKRFANLIIDSIVLNTLAVCLLIPVSHLFPSLLINPLVSFFIGLFLRFAYYFLFEVLFQRTPAKFITGTKVVTLAGSKATPAAIAIRTVSRFVPFEPLSRSEKTWWHDRWTDTRVVDGR